MPLTLLCLDSSLTKHIAVFSLPSIPSCAPPLPFFSSPVAELERIIPLGMAATVVVLKFVTVVSAAPGIPFAETVGMWLLSTIVDTFGFESTRAIVAVGYCCCGFLNCVTFGGYAAPEVSLALPDIIVLAGCCPVVFDGG